MPSELQVRSASFRFVPARYLRFCFRVLTASSRYRCGPAPKYLKEVGEWNFFLPHITPCAYRGFSQLPVVYLHMNLPGYGEDGSTSPRSSLPMRRDSSLLSWSRSRTRSAVHISMEAHWRP